MNTTTQPVYDVFYFLNKFRAIPSAYWCMNTFQDGNGRRCARGHCLSDDFADIKGEDAALRQLFLRNGITEAVFPGAHPVAYLNNGHNKRYQQPTPKQRIIAALLDIAKAQDPTFENPPLTSADLLQEKGQEVEHA